MYTCFACMHVQHAYVSCMHNCIRVLHTYVFCMHTCSACMRGLHARCTACTGEPQRLSQSLMHNSLTHSPYNCRCRPQAPPPSATIKPNHCAPPPRPPPTAPHLHQAAVHDFGLVLTGHHLAGGKQGAGVCDLGLRQQGAGVCDLGLRQQGAGVCDLGLRQQRAGVCDLGLRQEQGSIRCVCVGGLRVHAARTGFML